MVESCTNFIYDCSVERSLTKWGKTGNRHFTLRQEMEWLCTWKKNTNQLRHAQISKTRSNKWRRQTTWLIQYSGVWTGDHVSTKITLLFSLVLDKTYAVSNIFHQTPTTTTTKSFNSCMIHMKLKVSIYSKHWLSCAKLTLEPCHSRYIFRSIFSLQILKRKVTSIKYKKWNISTTIYQIKLKF